MPLLDMHGHLVHTLRCTIILQPVRALNLDPSPDRDPDPSPSRVRIIQWRVGREKRKSNASKRNESNANKERSLKKG